jgi:cytosine/adenosine deaminase-related metal-dependent hydrolase
MLTELYKKLNIDISFFVPPGKRSLPYYIPFLNGVEKLILVHNTYSISEDIREAKAIIPELFLCVCIKANQYIENAVPDLSKLSQEKVKLIIGTDSLASNDSLSILSELKSIHKAFPEISLETLFTWACLNGADSLGIKNTFGSFEKGKKPGVLLLSNLEFGFENSKVKRLF